MRKTLIIGQFPYPIKGISLSNITLYKGLIKSGFKVDYINTESNNDRIGTDFGSFSFAKLSFIKHYFLSYKIIFYQNIYITIGITFFGVLKYAPFIILSWLFDKNLIVHLHSNYLITEYQNLSGIKKNIFTFLLKKFDKGIVLSESLRPNLQPFIDNKDIISIPNFVQDELLKEIKIVKDYSEIKLFFLSNLLEEKGINILLNALERLQKENIFFKVKIAGSMVPSNPLLDFEKVKDVEYLGVVEGIEKQNLLLWGNVFCLPTFFSMEGQPISIIEAMAFDNFIVTTKHAGIPDICSEENAMFCDKNSEEDLYEKLKFLYNNWINYIDLAKNNGVYARKEFTEVKFVKRIIRLL
ncbi:glycosyltransferase family 4 protein [Flavobacterium sp. HNIBRBA15423]|uniref:glycosyltransferase family 4 protein n=1 Tax=Flavobacterium sp. HNIBRBA15423 TaxID=3458683 RepID=UPI004044A6B6